MKVMTKDSYADRNLGTSELVTKMLRERIMSGDMIPGQPLREVSLSSEFGVSRNTLREALRQLTADGLVEQKLYKGAVVQTLSRRDVRDIYVVRRVLELQAIEHLQSATKGTLEELRIAASIGQRAYDAGDWKEYSTANLRFHMAIVSMLGSDKINEFFSVTLAQLRLIFTVAKDEGRFALSWPPRNQELYELIAARDKRKAKKALQEYLDLSEETALGAMRRPRRASKKSSSA